MGVRDGLLGGCSLLLLGACGGSTYEVPPPTRDITQAELTEAEAYLAMQTPLPTNWTFTDVPFEGQGNLRVGLAAPAEPRATVMLVPGYTSSPEVASDLIADWYARGFEVASLDLPGQGGSMRREDDYQKPYTGDFSFYGRSVDEAARYVAANRQSDGPLIVAGSSFGGASVLRSAADGGLEDADGFFLVAPAVAPALDAPKFLVKWSLKGAVNGGRGSDYLEGQGPWQPENVDDYDFTYCGDRPERNYKNKSYNLTRPEMRVGGVTAEWALGMITSGEKLLKDPEIRALDKPVTMVTAGREVIVRNEPAERVCRRGLGACEVVHLEEATHCFVAEDEGTQKDLGDALVGLLNRLNEQA